MTRFSSDLNVCIECTDSTHNEAMLRIQIHNATLGISATVGLLRIDTSGGSMNFGALFH